MPTEKEKMISGAFYDPGDAELARDRVVAQRFMRRYNQTTLEDATQRRTLLTAQLGALGERGTIRAPIYVDYGYNIFVGDRVFINYGCVMLDICPIRIGSDAEIGPGAQLYAADHPRTPDARAATLDTGSPDHGDRHLGKPITIGDNAWIGGHAIILPGITIGDHAVVGAGSVVTRNVPTGGRVAGNPARPI